MMLKSLGDHERADRRQQVSPNDVDARSEAVWQRIGSQLANKPKRTFKFGNWLIPAGLATAAAAGLLLVLRPLTVPSAQITAEVHSAPVLTEGARLRSAPETSHLSLPDGSKVVAESFADLELLALRPDTAVFHLRSGRASFDVIPNPKRQFTVQTGTVQVHVLGTAFTVTRTPSEAEQPGRVEVSVLRGTVEVAHSENLHKLHAGETYAVEDPAIEPPLPASSKPHSDAPATSATPHKPAVRAAAPDLAALRFQAATEARLAKQHERAAELYETFLKLHPNDPRASLVAFELGRTRMDVLGDPVRAILALQRSLRLGPQSTFREDALARLVRLHETQGHASECAKAQQDYVREFPQGRLVGDVRLRCRDL